MTKHMRRLLAVLAATAIMCTPLAVSAANPNDPQASNADVTVNHFPRNYTIPKASQPPKIDGVIDSEEWSDALKVELKSNSLSTIYGESPTIGDSEAYLYWNSDGLYIAAHINDTTGAAKEITDSAESNIIYGDSLMLVLWGMNSQKTFTDGTQMAWIVLRPTTDGVPIVYEHYNLSSQIPDSSVAVTYDVSSDASAPTAYTIEAMIPSSFFDTLYENGFVDRIKTVEGQKFKLDFMINDYNGTESTINCNSTYCDPSDSDIYTLGSETQNSASTFESKNTVPMPDSGSVEHKDDGGGALPPIIIAAALAIIALSIVMFVVYKKKSSKRK